MKFGVVGLGRMGGNLALHAVEKGHEVIGFDAGGAPAPVTAAGVRSVSSLPELAAALPAPRVVLVYVPHGPVTEQVVHDLGNALSHDDILVDGGNSHWRDSARHALELKGRGIRFLDVGTSGGVEGAQGGACFMAGGDPEAFRIVAPILRDLAVPEGVAHVGPAGAGHFAKLIHNAIEFGMVQAIGEGVELLTRSEYDYDLPALFHNWAHGSVIRGWLVELMEKGLRENPDLGALSAYVEDTREVKWAVEYALDKEVWIPVIAESEMAFYKYRDADSVTAKIVAILRHGYGGHPIHRKDETGG
jgi:6-phosphogluconate dehydrogenase